MSTQADTKNFRTAVIVVDQVTEEVKDGKPYMAVIDMAGNHWKINQGLNGKLKARWNLLTYGRTLRLQVGLYKGNEYVEDFDSVHNIYEQEAAKRLQTQQKSDRNESIEQQVAVKIITDLQINKLPIDKDLITGRDEWLRHALRNFIGDGNWDERLKKLSKSMIDNKSEESKNDD